MYVYDTMKQEYPHYGSRTPELEKDLTSQDRTVLKDFLRYCAMTAGPNRLAKYRRYLLHFRDIVEKPLDRITEEDAITFWGLVRIAPYEEHTKIAIRKSVKRFLKWHYRDLDMLEKLQIPSTYMVNNEKVNKSTLFTPSELQLMLHQAEKLRDKALLILLYETAGRPQEIRDLKWRDVNWEEREVHLYSKKTKGDRDLPLNEAIKQLKRWKREWVYPDPEDEDYIFPSIVGSRPDRTRPISVSYINRIIKRLARRVGITRSINTYLLRHTRLTEIRKLGIQGVEFNKFAGHRPGSKQETVYVHLDNEDMKRSVIEKVYKIQEEGDATREYEERIARLESQLQEVIVYLKQSRSTMAQAGQQLECVDGRGKSVKGS